MLRSAIALAAAVSVPAAAQLHVPGDYADLQAALDASSPGGVVIVHGGVHGPISIGKPIRIVGDPPPLIVAFAPGGVPAPAAITLAGPGGGEVSFVRVRVGDDPGAPPGPAIAGACPAGIAGSGFDELLLLDCDIQAPAAAVEQAALAGAPGIDVDLAHVLAAESEVRASTSVLPGCAVTGPDGAPGFRSTGWVTLLDCQVTGGAAGPVYCNELTACGDGCPAQGRGGDAVVCVRLYGEGNTLIGGSGAVWIDPFGATCCPGTVDGVPVVAGAEVPLGPGLTGPAIVPLGGAWSLSYAIPGSSVLIFASLGSSPPLELPGLGVAYVDLATHILLGAFPAGSQVLPFTVGGSPALAGLRVCFQALSDAPALTRPVVAAFAP